MRLLPTRRRDDDTDDLFVRETPPDNGALQPPISAFWDSLWGSGAMLGAPWSPRLQDRVWTANRCLQLCAQQIASMPLRFFGAPSASEPAWVANPDPVWYPNGIGDAVFAATWSMLGWGDAFLLITNRYADGFPSAFTVLDPAQMNVQLDRGRRTFRSGSEPLNPDDVVQISRDPRGGLRGTSALASYATIAWGLTAAGELGRSMASGGGVPNAVLKSTRKLTEGQATALQNQWVNARLRAGIGAPAVLPPEISFEQLAFSAEDLALLDVQQYDAKVIASAFSVPAFMLNLELTGGLTYQNPETLFEVWWRSELRPSAGRIQRALSANMLPRGSWVEFDARAVLAPTFQGQVATWTQLVKEGIVTKNEMRAAILHLPPLEEGEALDDLTEPPTAAASPSDQGPSAVVQELRPTAVVT
jgi:HK97 family phage portal protein